MKKKAPLRPAIEPISFDGCPCGACPSFNVSTVTGNDELPTKLDDYRERGVSDGWPMATPPTTRRSKHGNQKKRKAYR